MPSTDLPILTPEAARRLLIHGQRLGKNADKPLQVMQGLIAVQTQYALSLPGALATRSRSFKKGWESIAIQPGKGLVKTWTIRYTLHTLTDENFELLRAAFGERHYDRYLWSMLRYRSITELDVRRNEDLILKALESGPKTRAELHDAVPQYKGMPGTGWGMDVMGLAFRGEICMVSQSGATQFCLRTQTPCALSKSEAIAEAIRRYLRAYGYGSRSDFAHWAGCLLRDVNQVFDSMQDELVSMKLEGRAVNVLAGTPEETQDVRIPKVKLLTKFDVLLLGHKDKTLYLPEIHRKRVFRIAAQVEAPVLVDGVVQGTWRMKSKGSTLQIFIERWPDSWSKSVMSALESEAAGVSARLGFGSFENLFVPVFGE